MSFSSATVSIGDATEKSDYDVLMANTVYNKAQTISEISRIQSGTVSFEGAKTFQSASVFNATATFNSTILPTTSPTTGSQDVGIGANAVYTFPRGIWDVYENNADLQFKIRVNSTWREISTLITGGIFSSGSDVAIVNGEAAINSFSYNKY